MALPTIQIKDIPDEGLALDVPLPAPWVRAVLEVSNLAPVGDPAGRLLARLQLSGTNALLAGTVEATVTGQCVRCLNPVNLTVRSEFALHLEPAAAAAKARHGAKEEIDLTADDLDVDHYDNDRIELD